MERFRRFGLTLFEEVRKIEKKVDGLLMVSGEAASSRDPAKSRSRMPDSFMVFRPGGEVSSEKAGSRARRVKGSDIRTIDPNGMASKAREWVERLRGLGVRRKEIKEIEGLLKEGKVREAYIKSGTLITIVEEMRPDALARKLVDISRRGERCLFDILEISRDLADIEVWKQHLTAQRDFDAFCQTVLKITPGRARAIIALSDNFSFAPEGLGPSEVLNALVDVAKTLSSEDE